MQYHINKILVLTAFFLFSISQPAISQCVFEVDNNGFEYTVDAELEVTDEIYTQNGTTCNVQLEITYDIVVDIITKPAWWNESLYTLQGFFDCAGASGISTFDLPNSGGTGTVVSATFSFNNENCIDVNLDCPISIVIQGPELTQQTTSCDYYASESFPIILSSFKYGKIEQNKIKVDWSTESEFDFSHFELQKSIDLKSWTTLATIKGSNTTHGNDYNYTIDSYGENQYLRLKMVDIDGYTDYSKVLLIPETTSTPLSIFPNPTSNRLYIAGNDTKEVTIINNVGIAQNFSVEPDRSINVSSLPSGYYIIQCHLTNGLVQSIPFIKQ